MDHDPMEKGTRRMFPWEVLKNLFTSPPEESPSLPQEYLEGTMLVSDRVLLLDRLPKGGAVAELGVDEGGYSREILARCMPEKLYLIDCWESRRYHDGKRQAVERRFASEIASGQVEILHGESLDMLSRLPDASLDWIYIDTSHRYQQTCRELEASLKKVKPDGYIAGHDYAVGNHSKHLYYGVIRAVNEFCLKHGWRLAFLTNEPDRYLSFVLRKK
jgi:predicted O-methyltransferase YrrM